MGEVTEKEYDEYLDADGKINVCGNTYWPSQILKDVDPTAYSTGYTDWSSEQEDV